MSELAASSFDFYDGVRILLPGAIITGLYQAIVRTFALHVPLPTSDALTALIIVSIAGLSLYFVDIPSRSTLYPAALPHKILEGWGKPPAGMSGQNVYFVLMDTLMPPAIRSRAQYFNSMFRIGFELIVLLCLAGTGVTTVAQLTADPSNTADPSGAQRVMLVACGLFVVLGVCALASAYLKAGGRGSTAGETSRAKRLIRVRERLSKQVPCIDRLLLLVAAVLSGLYMWTHHAAFLAGAATIVTAVWFFRYLRGVFAPREGTEQVSLIERLSVKRRRNLEASTSTLTVCFAALVIAVPAAVCVPRSTHLTLGTSLGWTAVTFAGATLMLFRGHEVKLWGAYYTVSTWMSMNRQKIVSEFDLQQDESTTPR